MPTSYLSTLLGDDSIALDALCTDVLQPLAARLLHKHANGFDPSFAFDILQRGLDKLRSWLQSDPDRHPANNEEFLALCYTFLRNEAHALRRQEVKHRSASATSLDENVVLLNRHTPHREILDLMEGTAVVEWMLSEVHQFPPRSKDVFLSVFFRGEVRTSIAARHGMTDDALRALLTRLRVRLRTAAPAWVIAFFGDSPYLSEDMIAG